MNQTDESTQSTQSTQLLKRPPLGHQRTRRSRHVQLGVAISAIIAAASASGVAPNANAAAPNPVLKVTLTSVPRPVRDGVVVRSSLGPNPVTVIRGKGSIAQRRTGGRTFATGGQQSTDTAFLNVVGPPASSLFTPDAGDITIRATSLVSVARRSSPTGRNIHTLAELNTGLDDSPGSTALALALVANPNESPYVSFTVNGVGSSAAITPEIASTLAAGRRYTLRVAWSNGTGRLLLNSRELATLQYPMTPPRWNSQARFTLGAGAGYGGGYFSAHQDSLELVTMSATTSTTSTTSASSTLPTTTGASTRPTTTKASNTTTSPPTVPPTAPTTPTTRATTVPTTRPATTVPATTPPTTPSTTLPPVGGYPAQWDWDPASTLDDQPQPATQGTPLIKQIRNGVVIAEYTRLGGGSCAVRGTPECGAFSRGNTFLNKRDGDIFEVYPAVYEGEDQQPWFGPMFESDAGYARGEFITVNNIIIRGVTVNGKRPVIRSGAVGGSNNTLGQGLVYFGKGANITMENIDIDGGGTGRVGKAGVYVVGTENLTLRNMRIHGFRISRANGVFGGAESKGTLLLDRVQLYDNGGDSGPEHNIYMNKSTLDPNFTVKMTNSFSSSAYYGHLYKSRAQINILEGNYFKGTVPFSGEAQAENYLVEVPEGGRFVMRNNILAKNKSGDNSNGIMVFYAAESAGDGRPNSILIEHNTFVTFSKYYDNADHVVSPFAFYYPNLVPGTAGFPVASPVIRNNVFVGFDNAGGSPMQQFRGDNPSVVGFSAIRQDFSLVNPTPASTNSILGSPSYRHLSRGGGIRTKATVGAVD